jgi:serine protease
VAALLLSEDSSQTPADVTAALVSKSSKDRVSDPRSGSPNRLLFSLDGDDVPPVDPVTELNNGETVQASGKKGDEVFYKITVPAGADQLQVSTTGGSGDADLYVRRGDKPSTGSFDCRPYVNGNVENCDFASPAADDWYIMLRGYDSFSNVSLTATYSVSQCTGDDCLTNGETVSGLSGARGDELRYRILVPANQTLTVDIAGNSGDADLYVRQATAPTLQDYECRPYQSGSNERCQVTPTTDTMVHIMVRGYSAFSGLSLQVSY